ncbi:hypothetical protein SAMN06272765_7103 [Streptomyces sp. Ag109_G2-15]|nr:hypothetical protein SAMN06272765_7103 [Streptomyces sp. Ag109_G2-15]
MPQALRGPGAPDSRSPSRTRSASGVPWRERPAPADRRVKLTAATEKGSQVAKGLRESLRFAREPLAGLVEERVVLRGLLLRMLEAERADRMG